MRRSVFGLILLMVPAGSAAVLAFCAAAERAGCHVFPVSKLERGTQEPAWPLVLALAKALGVSTEAFIDRDHQGWRAGHPAEPRPRGRPPKARGQGLASDTPRGDNRPEKPRSRPRKEK